MCRIVEPGTEHSHAHVSEPIEVAELLRDSLVQELASTGDLAAHWHMVEDDAAREALSAALASKRAVVAALYRALVDVEDRTFAQEYGAGHGHGHAHPHEH